MLLIGDIHINSKYKDKIISNIRNFVDKFPEEKNIVFMGDYVYHFSYDRKAILNLFELFLELFHSGKTVYVLAGNHDWLSQTFVFEEVKKSFDIMNDHFENKIFFINDLLLTNIEGVDVLFLPFSIDYQIGEQSLFENLSQSKNKNENISATINTILKKYADNIQKKLFVFHHFYFEGINFPGQFSKFSYKDIALSKDFLSNYPKLFFVSGHLHKGFVHQNYLCTGSVYNTSPIEQNDFKFFYKMDLGNLHVNAFLQYTNPYIVINQENDVCITKDIINQNIKNYFEQTKASFGGGAYKVEFDDFRYPNLNDVSLIIKSQNMDYDNISSCLEEDLINQIKDLKIKKQLSQQNVLEKLDLSNKDLQQSISDWRSLLKDFITNKYDNGDKYLQVLQELKII